MEHLNLIINNRSQFTCQLLSLIMVVISLEIEYIFLEFDFGFFSFFYGWVLRRLILIFITLVVPASRLVMILPRPKAHPAEVGSADFAVHVITPLILLNRPLTFRIGTHFRISNDPRQILTLARILELPFLPHIAICRPMLLLGALETKAVAALAIDDVLRVVLRDALGGEVALLRVGTPLDILVIVGERLAIPAEVSVQDRAVRVSFRVEELVKHRMRNDHVASKLLAVQVQTLFRVCLNVDLEPVAPAALTKLMAAHQLQRHALLISRLLRRIEICVANDAEASVVGFLASVERHQLLLIHRLFNIRIKQNTRIVFELRLIRKPALRHQFTVPFAEPENRYGLIFRHDLGQAVLLQN